MRYGSVCSGIEAATQAWHPLGWTPAFFSEIEAFPSAVLAHHYGSNLPGEPASTNGVPNHGDMTKFEEWPDHAIELLVGGTPCQSFSVAGLRGGLDDARGNLMLTYGAIARRYRPRWLVWENVPGVLSSDGGRDFASLLGLLSGRRVEVPATGWRNAGVVEGYKGAYGLAWRVLDAQYVRVDGFEHAVPQRRRRVFVVGYIGDWRPAAAVLFEPEGLRGDSAPRRQAGKGFTRDVAQCLVSSGRGVERTGDTRGQDVVAEQFVDDAARCVTAGYAQRLDWETENFVAHAAAPIAPAITKNPYGDHESRDGLLVAHTLKGEGFDASEDGAGRGTPIVPVIAKTLTRGAESAGKGGYAGRRQEDDDNLVAYPLRDVAPTLTGNYGKQPDSSDTSAGPMLIPEIAGTMKSMEHSGGWSNSADHAAAGYMIPIPLTLAIRGRDGQPDIEWRQDGTSNAILTPNGGRAGVGVGAVAIPFDTTQITSAANYSNPKAGDPCHPLASGAHPPAIAHAIQAGALRENPASGPDGVGVQADIAYTLEARAEVQAVQQSWAVRRLTPTECARLQGFPDNHCRIPWRGKPAEQCPDGPQYKGYGNSMAVNAMRWIGMRIDMMEKIIQQSEAAE